MYRTNAAKSLGLCSIAAMAFMSTPVSAQSMGMASAADRSFMMKASEANIGEIAAGKLAEQRGSHSVQLLGKRFVDNHSTNQQQLVMLAQKLHVMLPMHPSADDQMMAAKLKTLHGAAFDSAFLAGEQKGHMKNISAFKAEAASSSSPMIVAYVKSSIPVLEEHLDIATDDANRMHMHMAGMGSMNGSSASGMSGNSGAMGNTGAMNGNSGAMGSSGNSGAMGGTSGTTNGAAMQHSPGSPQNPAGQNANQSPVNNANGSSPATGTAGAGTVSPATGAGQMQGSGTPSSPNGAAAGAPIGR